MSRSYIISEIGNNHNGSVEKALQLIDASAAAGVDAVKFQTFRGIDIVSPKVKANEYKGWDVKNFEYWYQFLDSIALKLEDHQKVIDYSNSKKLHFVTTPTSPFIVQYLEKLKGIKAYKIASMDLTNIALLQAIAKTKKEIIMSTGMGEINEIKAAIKILKRRKLTILHCVSDYPLDPDKAFLNNITLLKKTFPKHTIGFSDHSLGHELSVAARSLGATVFEKHITLDRKDPSPAEHHFAMEPNEFGELVKWIRHIDANMDVKKFGRSESEKVNKFKYRRSFHYATDLKKGTVLKADHLSFVRPGEGIGYAELKKLIGKKLKKDVKAFDPCNLKDVE